MLTVEQIREKLFELPKKFDQLCMAGEWKQAKHVYDTAVNITVFMELDLEDRIQLFGNRTYKEDDDELKEGMFLEARVLRVYRESFKADSTTA
ncbi:MAG: hypothetical protein E7284_10065 [Lachnospiraceae bacterium]|nr:hypothetical protein [Lachnospiraceae bacterium]